MMLDKNRILSNFRNPNINSNFIEKELYKYIYSNAYEILLLNADKKNCKCIYNFIASVAKFDDWSEYDLTNNLAFKHPQIVHYEYEICEYRLIDISEFQKFLINHEGISESDFNEIISAINIPNIFKIYIKDSEIDWLDFFIEYDNNYKYLRINYTD